MQSKQGRLIGCRLSPAGRVACDEIKRVLWLQSDADLLALSLFHLAQHTGVKIGPFDFQAARPAVRRRREGGSV